MILHLQKEIRLISNKEIQRSFILGDSWVYYKIYSGSKTSDKILLEIIKPLTEYLLSNKIIDKWFFIRYADPKHHLRFRLHYTNPENIGLIINCLNSEFKKFSDQDLIWKVQADTYQREIERYGGNTMVLSEDLFFYDSKMIINFINLIENDQGEELRWLFSLKAIDLQLNTFGLNLKEKLELLNQLKTNFSREFNRSKLVNKQLNDKYRKEYNAIEEIMHLNVKENSSYTSILRVLMRKEEEMFDIASKVLKYRKEKKLEVDFNNLMCSYIHMLMNRLFKSKNRLNEMVCYDFLYRYYRSQYARGLT